MIKNKRILITGGAGFCGSHLAEMFAQNNKVTILDNLRRDSFKFLPESIKQKCQLISADIRNEQDVKKALQQKDIIIHLAAVAGISSYENDPLETISVNLLGTATLLKNLIAKKAELVIIFSSGEIYGPNAYNKSEEDPALIGPVSEPRWSYAASKIASEHLAMAYFRKYRLPIIIVRPFNIFGPRQSGQGAIADMIRDAITTGKITVTGTGLQRRAWCYIDDLKKAVELIIKKPIFGQVFNIGNPKNYLTVLNLAKKIQELAPGSSIIFKKGVKIEIIDRLPNISKAKKVLGFSPKISLEEGLKKTFDWYLHN